MENLVIEGKKAHGRLLGEKGKRILFDVLTHMILIFFALLVLIPFYIILITSVKTNLEASNPEFSLFPKNGFHFESYKNVLSLHPLIGRSILKGFLTTIWINILPTVVGLFMSAMSAFALAKVKFRGRNFIFSVMMLTMMIPSIITLTPSYLIYSELDWIGTPLPLILPGLFGSGSCLFFMRQYFLGLPDELIEAARIDGLKNFGVYVRIVLPLSKPALISQFLIIFIGRYNDYLGPLLYLANSDYYTLQLALWNNLGTFINDWPSIMAGCVVALAPLLLIYLCMQKYFLKGIAISSGIKG